MTDPKGKLIAMEFDTLKQACKFEDNGQCGLGPKMKCTLENCPAIYHAM